jgi:ABC-type dipeptide/oligopeptide/nickel transport system ATPase subunit
VSFQIRPARRANVPLVIGLPGPSGSGKTYSALLLARGLAGTDGQIVVIDTENGRSQMYEDVGAPWQWLDFQAPFTPERYVEAIAAAEQASPAVIVLDSISHEYDGQGGLFDIQEAYLAQHAGNDEKRRASLSFTAWNAAKIRHKQLVTQILQLRCHLIVCMRAQDKIELVKVKGKLEAVPKKSMVGVDGWEPICERRLPYELTTSLLLLPSAPGVPKPIKLPEPLRALVPLDRPLDEQVGAQLAQWATGAQEPTADEPSDGTGAGEGEGELGEGVVSELSQLRKAAHVSDDWLRTVLEQIGFGRPDRITLATIRRLNPGQAELLKDALSDELDAREHGEQLTTHRETGA